MTRKNPNHVFVYGTLKKGHIANYMMQEISHYVNTAKINGIMYDLGSYPGILEDSNSYVYGEIYVIKDQDALKVTDKYEGFYPDNPGKRNLFVRNIVIAFCDDKSQIPVFAYFYNDNIKNSLEIHSGVWNKK